MSSRWILPIIIALLTASCLNKEIGKTNNIFSDNTATNGSAPGCVLSGAGTLVTGGSSLTDQAALECNLVHGSDLGNLDDFGGYSWSYSISADSLAIDAGQAASCAALTTDQRGYSNWSRSIDGDFDAAPVCDIGAFEFQ